MLRALSTRRPNYGYERLGEEAATGLLHGKLKRAASVSLPSSRVFGSSKTSAMPAETTVVELKKQPTKKVNKGHPLFSLFYARRKKKTTAKPEFARYLDYVREAGIWDMKSNVPVIHYK